MLVVSRFEPGNRLSRALGTGAVSRHVRRLPVPSLQEQQ